ncbi:MAG: hypothetical protein KC468_04530 [Myxococcales bacterium]|nr:hypothetical protein [Myxococcales bacterium]
MRSRLALAGVAPLALAAAGCFTGTFAAGHPCQEDADCGPQLACQEGYCDGRRPSDDTTASASDGASSTTDATTSATTEVDPSTSSTGAETTGSPYLCDKIDVLVVLDSSNSMNQWDNQLFALASQFISFASTVLDQVGSYHIGVISTSALPELPDDCEVPGTLWVDELQGQLCASYGEKRYIDEHDTLDVLNLGCLTRVEADLDDELPMHAMLQAVSSEFNDPGGCNEGFIRPDALLVVMLLTDEDDDHADEQGNNGSPGDPQFWYDKLLYHKRGNEEGIVVGALLGEDPLDSSCPWMLPDDKSEKTVSTMLSIGAEEGVRVRQFLDRLPVGHAYVSSICDDSYVNFFQQFYENIVFDACEDFDPLATDPMVPDPTAGDTG